MRGGESNLTAAPLARSESHRPRRGLHVGTDAGRLWIVVGRWSVLITPRHVVVGLILLALSLAVAVAALRLGKFTVSTPEVIDALQGQGRRIVQVVVVKWKLPRILLGLVAGLALGVAGAVFQTITRNPLGSPDLIGFSTGAQTGILVSVLLLPGSMLSTSLASFIGGAAVGAVTYLVSLRGGFTGLRFILVGIAISSMLVSVNRWLLVRVDDDEGLGALKAITGTLGAARWPVVAPTCLAIGVTVALILLSGRRWRPLAAWAGGLFTIAMGYSTLVCQWHRPSDVLAGIFVPVAWGALAVAGGAWRAPWSLREGTGEESSGEVPGLTTVGTIPVTAAGPRLWNQFIGNVLLASVGIVCTLGALGLGTWVWRGLEGPDSRWQLFGAYASGSVAVVGVTCLTLSALVSLTDWGRTRHKHEPRHRD